MLAAIWKQLEELKPKENEVKPVSTSICRECGGVKVITREGLPTCSACGIVDSYFVDDSAEWTSGITDDGKVNDPSRCGNPNANPELFSQNWVRVQLYLHNTLQHMRINEWLRLIFTCL